MSLAADSANSSTDLQALLFYNQCYSTLCKTVFVHRVLQLTSNACREFLASGSGNGSGAVVVCASVCVAEGKNNGTHTHTHNSMLNIIVYN